MISFMAFYQLSAALLEMYETLLVITCQVVPSVDLITWFENIKVYLYLASAVFIAQRLVGPSKQLKQIIQIEHKIHC